MAIIVPIVEWSDRRRPGGHHPANRPLHSPPRPDPAHHGRRSPVAGPPPGHHSNNNEVYAHELVRAFDAFPPLNNPWNRAVFDKNVAQNIGVYTTQETKLEALSELLASLLKNQVAISEGFFTVGAEAFNPKEDPAEPEEQIDILCEQLKNFTDHDDGSISGKSAGTRMTLPWLCSLHHSSSSVKCKPPWQPVADAGRFLGTRLTAQCAEGGLQRSLRQRYTHSNTQVGSRAQSAERQCRPKNTDSTGRKGTQEENSSARAAHHSTPRKKTRIPQREVHAGPWYRCGRCLVVCKSWKAFKGMQRDPYAQKSTRSTQSRDRAN